MKANESDRGVYTSFLRDMALPCVLLVGLVAGLNFFGTAEQGDSAPDLFGQCFNASAGLVSEKAIVVMLRNGVVL